MLTSVKDLEYMMNWSTEDAGAKKKAGVSTEGFEGNEQSIMQVLASHSEGQLSLDELSWRLNLSMGQLATALLGLELKGAVRSMPGKRYKLSAQ